MNNNQNSLNRKIWKELKDIFEKLKGSRGEEEINQCILRGVMNLCKILELPPRFSNVFGKFQKHEGILYTLPYYRDHFIHMFHVFCLGYFILNKWWINEVPFFGSEDNDRKNEVLKTWFIASIQHDIAYPVERAEIWVPRFPKDALDLDIEILSYFDWSPILVTGESALHIEKMTENFLYPLNTTSNEDEIYRKKIAFKNWFNKQLLEKHDHGALGSLSILNFGWRESELECVYNAALIVLLHNYSINRDVTIGELTFKSYPLAFLLTYCDTVQEWGRTQTEPLNGLHRLFDTSTKFERLDVTRQYTTVTLSYNIEERCRKRVKSWSRLDKSEQKKERDQEEDAIRTSIHKDVQLVCLAWQLGNLTHRFDIKTQDENEKEFCSIRII